MKSGQNGKWSKWKVDKMESGQNEKWPNEKQSKLKVVTNGHYE